MKKRTAKKQRIFKVIASDDVMRELGLSEFIQERELIDLIQKIMSEYRSEQIKDIADMVDEYMYAISKKLSIFLESAIRKMIYEVIGVSVKKIISSAFTEYRISKISNEMRIPYKKGEIVLKQIKES